MGALKWLLPFGSILLVSCQSSGSFCDIAKPYRPTAEQIEQMTDEQVSQLLGHNQRGQALCGWRP